MFEYGFIANMWGNVIFPYIDLIHFGTDKEKQE